jgi:predicted XRE-type DNA-binding protein
MTPDALQDLVSELRETHETDPKLALALFETHQLKQAEIASLLCKSKPTISRYIREAREARSTTSRLRIQVSPETLWRYTQVMCALVITAAIAWIAWGWH